MRGKPNDEDLAGRPFGLLTAERRVGRARWECRCVCGKLVEVHTSGLLRKPNRSCGCSQAELKGDSLAVHGHSRVGKRTSTYSIYRSMLNRCYDPKNNQYHNYGGRGIAVCDRWRGEGGFERFLEDMGPCPPAHSIERERVNEGYGPDNCRWIPRGDQSDNRRDTKWITIDGRRQTLTQWAKERGIRPHTIWNRINDGWDEASAVMKPVRPHKPYPNQREDRIDGNPR